MSNKNSIVHDKVLGLLHQYPSKRTPKVTVSKETKKLSESLLVKHKIGQVAIKAAIDFNSKLKNELGF